MAREAPPPIPRRAAQSACPLKTGEGAFTTRPTLKVARSQVEQRLEHSAGRALQSRIERVEAPLGLFIRRPRT